MSKPNDLAAERAVLGGLANHGTSAWADVSDLVAVDSFTLDSNAIIFRCLEHRLRSDDHCEKIEFPEVMSSANALGLTAFFDSSDEKKHLRAVLAMATQPGQLRRYAGLLKKLEIARTLARECRQTASSLEDVTGDESIDQIIGLAEGPALDMSARLAHVGNDGPTLMGEGMAEYFQYLVDNPRQQMGVPTGLPCFDRTIGGGLREGCVNLIGARQKEGKSMACNNIGMNVAELQIPSYNADTEMEKTEHQVRIGARIAGVPIEDIECGRLSNEQYKKAMAACDRLLKIPYYHDCVRGLQFQEILARMRRWILHKVGLGDNGKANPCVILYDYLKLMGGEELRHNLAEHQALGFNASSLKNLMGQYGARCLCLAQLNRDGLDYEDTRVLRGSDRILDTVTSFSIYKKLSDEEKAAAPKYTHKLITLLSRHGHGMTDGDFIYIRAEYTQGRVIEGPTRNQYLKQKSGGQLLRDTTDQDNIGF